MSAMTAQPRFGGAIHRKPVGAGAPGIAVRPPQSYAPAHAPAPSSSSSSSPRLGPESLAQQQPGHSRTRTTSSGIFPQPAATASSASSTMQSPQFPSQASQPSQLPPQVMGSSARRTLSNATSSTSSTSGAPARSNSNGNGNGNGNVNGGSSLRRSSSARSGNSPTSYVALMRKQKATVWCDRGQSEDPRILAQQRAAKMRANMEVAGGPHHAPPRNSSGSSGVASGVRSKIQIRHHGAQKTSQYAPVNLAGTGVPMRLSASEVDEGDDEDGGSVGGPYHHRTGSGRSSLGSGRRVPYANPAGRLSSSSTPPSGHNSSPSDGMEDLMEEETPVPRYNTRTDYFEHTKTGLSGGSGSSGERNFGDVGQMPHALPKVESQKKGSDELHRRGSVDERTMTMSNTRLFIANPDLSD